MTCAKVESFLYFLHQQKQHVFLACYIKVHLVKSICDVCRSKKSKSISKQQAEGFLSNLFSKIPILNKIMY